MVLTFIWLVPLAAMLMGSCLLYTVLKLNTVEENLLLDWKSETLIEERVSPGSKLGANS